MQRHTKSSLNRNGRTSYKHIIISYLLDIQQGPASTSPCSNKDISLTWPRMYTTQWVIAQSYCATERRRHERDSWKSSQTLACSSLSPWTLLAVVKNKLGNSIRSGDDAPIRKANTSSKNIGHSRHTCSIHLLRPLNKSILNSRLHFNREWHITRE